MKIWNCKKCWKFWKIEHLLYLKFLLKAKKSENKINCNISLPNTNCIHDRWLLFPYLRSISLMGHIQFPFSHTKTTRKRIDTLKKDTLVPSESVPQTDWRSNKHVSLWRISLRTLARARATTHGSARRRNVRKRKWADLCFFSCSHAVNLCFPLFSKQENKALNRCLIAWCFIRLHSLARASLHHTAILSVKLSSKSEAKQEHSFNTHFINIQLN